jgi:peptidoglycan/xylan/chitin deacetylase (PgdA/CDA1 family)
VWTPAVLAALARARVRATFFLDAGRARRWPGCVEAILAGGHEAAFHCLRHRRHSEIGAAEVAADAAGGLAALTALGVKPRAWRAPWGIETEATRAAAAAHGLELRRWNRDSHDWRGDSRAEMEAGIEAEGGLCDGAVVLMHDGIGPGARRQDCAETVALAQALCERAAAAGLETVTVSELIAVAA